MSHLTQMIGLTVQNFVSAAVGMAVVVALIRGITRTGTRNLGNFWVDLVAHRRADPAAAVARVRRRPDVAGRHPEPRDGTTTDRPDTDRPDRPQRSPSSRSPAVRSPRRRRSSSSARTAAASTTPTRRIRSRTRTASPTSSQIFVAAADPVRRSSFAFGRLVSDKRQARVLIAVMAGILDRVRRRVAMFAEQNGNPLLDDAGVDQSMSVTQSGGNMEGKEVRFGAAGCGLFAGATTGTSTGAVNCMHDSFTPLGGLAPMAAHDARRDLAGRRRRRPDGHADHGPAGGVHRRPDGRAHARVPRQEDPGAGDEARHALHPGDAVRRARRSPRRRC